MKLNYLFATGTYLSYFVPLAGAANVPICHGNATQDATAFAIQVHDELQTTHCIAINIRLVCISNISMAASGDKHPERRRYTKYSMAIPYTFRSL
jgi:hypothetical protein